MLESTTPIITTFGGSFFEVAVYYSLIPPQFRSFIRVRQVAGGPDVYDTGIECSEHQLRELSALTKTTRELLSFLKEGGKLEEWGKELHEWRAHHGN